MSIKRIVTLGACALAIAAMTATASASSKIFAKGTKVYDKSGKRICTMNYTMALDIKGSWTNSKGVEYYKVKGRGYYVGKTGYIKKSAAKSTAKKKNTGDQCYITGSGNINMRNKNGRVIATVKAGTMGLFYEWTKLPTQKGTWGKVKMNGITGYVHWDYVDIQS